MTYVLVGAIVLAAFVAVAWPILRREDNDDAGLSDTAMEHRINEYRGALKAETVCKRCLRANPTDARYCAECGNPLREIEPD
jgi:predicted amidophosphoribosyltransferase